MLTFKNVYTISHYFLFNKSINNEEYSLKLRS